MHWIAVIAIVDLVLAAVLAGAILIREKRSVASLSFAAIMCLMAGEAFANFLCLQSFSPEEIVYWKRFGLIIASALPVGWLAFSLSYSRGNSDEFLRRWRFALILTAVIPLFLSLF